MLINCKIGDKFIYHAGKLLSKHGYFHAEDLKLKCHVVEILDDAIVLESNCSKKNRYYMTEETKGLYEKEEN